MVKRGYLTVKREQVLKPRKGENSKDTAQEDHKTPKKLLSQFDRVTDEVDGMRRWDWLPKASL